MLFSTHAPYASQTLPSASEASGKGSSNFVLKLLWLATESFETPRIVASIFEKSGSESRNAQASLVHPGVVLGIEIDHELLALEGFQRNLAAAIGR